MKILIINSSPFISGAEESLIQIVQSINNSELKIIMVVPENSYFKTLLFENIQIICLQLLWFKKSINPIQILMYLVSLIKVANKLKKIIKAEKIDLIYSNTTKSHIYSVFVRLFVKIKIVWHVRDNMKNSILKHLLIRFSDKIICISDHIYKQFNNTSKCIKIFNSIDLVKYSPSIEIKNNIREKINLLPEIQIVAHIGQITKWKNHFDFIRCAEIVLKSRDNIHFLIVGGDLSNNEQIYLLQLKKTINQLGLEDYITLFGYQNEIIEIYAQIDLLVHTAIDEPFGRVIIEAMAMEKPVVAYNCGGSKEIIQNGVSGFLVDPNNYKLLAKKVLALLNDKNLRSELGRKGRSIVQENFNIQNQIKQIEQIFNSI